MTLEIVFMVTMSFISIASVLDAIFSKRLLKTQRELLNSYRKDRDVMIRYCLTKIHNDSIQIEGYEMAIKCREMLKTLPDA